MHSDSATAGEGVPTSTWTRSVSQTLTRDSPLDPHLISPSIICFDNITFEATIRQQITTFTYKQTSDLHDNIKPIWT